ncbi:MAG: hypothetical protein HY953_09460 [Candidatus Rokubacteria bacterium]|nr:hypothetical protein [Candidatus Rokubacteria bacterium]
MAWGRPTVSLSNNPGATRRLMVPRWARVRFPRGSMLGEPGNRDKHLRVLGDALDALRTISSPGGSVELPYRWEADPVMWRGKPLTEGAYT